MMRWGRLLLYCAIKNKSWQVKYIDNDDDDNDDDDDNNNDDDDDDDDDDDNNDDDDDACRLFDEVVQVITTL